jgi:hypothetical protein
LLLLLLGLACLFPISMYCLFLARVHHRPRPTMISGPWDFAGVVMALSGFVLVGGTTLLFSLHSAVRDFWLRGGDLEEMRRAHAQSGAVTFVLWGLYFAVVVFGSAYLIWQRSDCTVLYNLAPLELDGMMAALLRRLGLPCTRRGTRLYIGYGPPLKPEVFKALGGDDGFDPAAPASDPVRKALVELDGSAAMRHVTMKWRFGARELRHELEAELARDFDHQRYGPGPASGWFVTAAGVLMMLMIFFIATFLLTIRR